MESRRAQRWCRRTTSAGRWLLRWWLLYACVAICLCLCSLALAAAPPYPDLRFTRHDGEDGPFRQSFGRLYRDRDGVLWGATLDSAFRFDGHAFEQWPIQGGTSALFSEDARGRLWVVTEQEIWRFDRERVQRTRIALPALRQSWGLWLAHSTNGSWLLASDGRLHHYSERSGTFEPHWQPPAQKYVLEQGSTATGVLWWVTDRALWRFSPAEDRSPRMVQRFSAMPLLRAPMLVIEPGQGVGDRACLALDTGIHCVRSDGAVWIKHSSQAPCTAMQVDAQHRLYALCGETLWSQAKTPAPHLQTRILQARLRLQNLAPEGNHQLQIDTNGRVWLALGNGFGIFDPRTGAYQAVPVGDEDDTGRRLPAPVFATNKMLADGDGVWFALNGKGLYRAVLSASPFQHWSPPAEAQSPHSPLLRAVYEDRDAQSRHLWLADATSRLWRIAIDATGQLQAGVRVAVVSPSGHSECRALLRAPDGTMLYATQDRLFAYRPQLDAFIPIRVQWPAHGPPMRPCGLHRDAQQRLWMYGAFGIALLHLDGVNGYRAEVYPIAMRSQWELFDPLYEASDGWWWIPSRIGIYRFHPKQHRWQLLSRATVPLASEWIHQILEQPQGLYWVATRGGGLQRLDLTQASAQTALFNPRRWQVIEVPPESLSPIRYSVLKDQGGSLWLAGGRGLDRYDPRGQHWLHFDASAGLHQIEFNHGAAAALSDGRLVFVGLNGLTLVRPDVIDRPRVAPAPRWRGVQIDGGPLRAAGASIALSDAQRGLTVHYQAVDYASPKGIRYRYRVHPNSSWVEVGDQRRLHLAGLGRGDHTLEVQAAYNNGDWPVHGIRLAIFVASPWYLRWPTWLVAAMFVCMSAAVYVSTRNRQQRKLEADVFNKTRQLRETAAELSASHTQLSASHDALQKSHGELREQTQRLELALSARERLFRSVSHEFRTPLTKIVLPLDEMIRRSGDSLATERMRAMRRNAERLRDMVDTLLDKAKAESELPDGYVNVALANEIIALSEDFAAIFAAKGQRFVFDCTIDPNIQARLSQDCLSIILDNLLGNASKYTAESGQIRLLAEIRGNMLMLEVSDTGIGMDAATCARIYSPFFRAQNASTFNASGHGLGLYLVLELVRRHGGDVSVVSAPGQGTTFTVNLPLDAGAEMRFSNAIPDQAVFGLEKHTENGAATLENAENAELSIDLSPSATFKKTLLVVEDEPDIRRMLVERLSETYRCIEAADGAAALKIAPEELPDLILCDIDLPEVNGYDVCMDLKSREQTAHIPVIFLTAYASDSARLQGLRVHGDDYIEKPPSLEELRLRIDNRLRTRDALLSRVRKGNLSHIDMLPDVPTKDQDIVDKALRLKRGLDAQMAMHYRSSEFRVTQLAKNLKLTTKTLQRHMTQYGFGETPQEYMRDYRLRMAAQALHENGKVTGVAEGCGLDPKTFSAFFKKKYGMTPSQWQKKLP
jgi:signal transduction histidine kinase/DNA-binding response OmpR family regulator/ligand-binding sensor domain-containing protein